MKICKKCENNLDDDSKFCTKCGEKIENVTQESGKIEVETEENGDINNIKNHLEFLGYSTEFLKGDGDRIILLCRHGNKPNIICTTDKRGVIFLTSAWSGLKEMNNIEQYKVLNTLHANATFSQFVIKDDGELNIHSTFIGDYDKKRFGEFVDIFLNDISQAINDESFKKLITK